MMLRLPALVVKIVLWSSWIQKPVLCRIMLLVANHNKFHEHFHHDLLLFRLMLAELTFSLEFASCMSESKNVIILIQVLLGFLFLISQRQGCVKFWNLAMDHVLETDDNTLRLNYWHMWIHPKIPFPWIIVLQSTAHPNRFRLRFGFWAKSSQPPTSQIPLCKEKRSPYTVSPKETCSLYLTLTSLYTAYSHLMRLPRRTKINICHFHLCPSQVPIPHCVQHM